MVLGLVSESYVSSLEAITKENLCERNLLGRGSQENKREWDVGQKGKEAKQSPRRVTGTAPQEALGQGEPCISESVLIRALP